MNSKKYNNTKLLISIAKGVSSFLLLFYFVYSGLSLQLKIYISLYLRNNYLILIAFVLVTGLAGGIIFAPITFYTDYILEHKYNLSNQTIFQWIIEGLKGILVSTAIGIPILLLFFYSLNEFGHNWWLPFAIALFVISILLARVLPVLILPIFYKISPLENEELGLRIKNLALNAGVKIENIYKFDMSKNTKKANAAFTGLGKSKRILLGDTLLSEYSHDEIETVIAHELGHYKYKHILKNIFIGTISSFLTLFLVSLLYAFSLSWFHFNEITDISALPLLVLWMIVIGLIQAPITNVISRRFEYQADEFAISSTRKTKSFISTLEKLTEQNLGDKNPHPFVEWFFYSHPSINKRISAIKKFELSLNGNESIAENLKYQRS